jgi:hypothetical protein
MRVCMCPASWLYVLMRMIYGGHAAGVTLVAVDKDDVTQWTSSRWCDACLLARSIGKCWPDFRTHHLLPVGSTIRAVCATGYYGLCKATCDWIADSRYLPYICAACVL